MSNESRGSTVNINDERLIRLKKMQELLEAGIDPYPPQVKRTHTTLAAARVQHGEAVSIVGRIMMKREIGKITFCLLQDETGRLQVALKDNELGEKYKLFVKKIDLGDIIAVSGERFVTKAGEESVLVKDWTILTKAILPMPDKFHGLQDEELRYRKRYLDFLLNANEKEKILVRGKILRYFRQFLYEKGFCEVETPVLESIASGAAAEPFKTHINAYGMDVFLRICMGELWQKRLMVGGFEKTFEIGRAFRNEGVDYQHNPEFTMLEYYWAYADHEDNLKMHEEMIPYIVQNSIGKLEVEIGGQKINFAPPFPKVTFQEVVKKYSGIDINEYPDTKSLKDAMREKGYEIEENAERGKLLDSLYKQSARLKIIQPTFVLNYPVELKPLAKKAPDARYTSMFQLIVNGFELSNTYTELNDPVDQRERFAEQAKLAEGGDKEAVGADLDFVEALEHGMPPTTGTGIGIDRFAALITSSHTLREVIAFPLVKPISGAESK